MTITDTLHLKALIHEAETEEQIQPLIREFLRSPAHGQLTAQTVPAWYSHGFDSKLRWDWYLAHRMILIWDGKRLDLFVKE